MNELKKDGIEGKTFLEIGCGPCPIGQKLANLGAKKIYGLDISSEMIETSRKSLTALGMIDKFELVCADIFDESFELPEKVDGVIISYVLTTFINNYDMLVQIIKQSKKWVKQGGYLHITDFSYVHQPKELFDLFGMYTATKYGGAPPDFEYFHFFIDKAPFDAFEIFQIPSHLMMKAGIDAGFTECDFKL
jgi:SAM-dependent methyltransferase